MIDIEKEITIYRNRDTIAMHSAKCPTIYITRAQALELASCLRLLAADISARKFTESTLSTMLIIDKGVQA